MIYSREIERSGFEDAEKNIEKIWVQNEFSVKRTADSVHRFVYVVEC